MHRTPDAETQDMPYRYSLYLDVLRFLAALAVFLDHLSIHPITKDLIWHRLGAYGSIAVTIFFALSGHVIAHVTATRERTLARYAGARIARMYSVVLVALAATWMLDNLGMALNPDLYAMQRIMWKPQSLEGYAASLLFINEYQIFNFNGIVPGSNGPYWSLSFEVTYYAIAGLCLFAPRTIAWPVAAGLLLAGGKTIAALFPIWVMGYLLYFVRIGPQHRAWMKGLFTLSIVLLVAAPSITGRLPTDNFGFQFPVGRGPFNRNLLADYLSAIFIAIHLVCARSLLGDAPQQRSPHAAERMVRWLGSLTFPLYLIHFPALAFFTAISPWRIDTLPHALFITAATFTLVIVLTPWTDALKYALRKRLPGNA
jgi:peptidoglycan/LPS O-acetylase OafA/YrhL